MILQNPKTVGDCHLARCSRLGRVEHWPERDDCPGVQVEEDGRLAEAVSQVVARLEALEVALLVGLAVVI